MIPPTSQPPSTPVSSSRTMKRQRLAPPADSSFNLDAATTRPSSSPKQPEGPKSPDNDRGRQRVRHACVTCRRRKAQCSADKPTCARCKEKGEPCYYAEGRREKKHRESKNVSRKAEFYEHLCLETLPFLDHRRRQILQDEIARMNYELGKDDVLDEEPELGIEHHSLGDEWSVRGDVGSPRAMDRAQHQEPGSSEGFLGKASVARLLQDAGRRVAEEPEAGSRRSPDHSGGNNQGIALPVYDTTGVVVQETHYYANDMDLSNFGTSGEYVQRWELPPRETADALLECFFTTIHLVYPVVHKSVFTTQYQKYWETSQRPNGSLTWLAMLNMMFAIGVIGMGSARQFHTNNERDHLIYFIRARLLHPDETSMIALPTFEHVQLSLLTGMYFATSYQINRAWHVIGSSVRCAHALALHLINDAPATTDAQKELETRTWHSICALELFLSFLSGRPASFNYQSNSTRMPQPIENDVVEVTHIASRRGLLVSILPKPVSSSSMAMLRISILLDKILADTMHNLYSASTVLLSWGAIQKHVSNLNSRLANWRSELPVMYRLEANHGNDKSPLPEKMYIALRYFSISMMINRPCLCELSHHATAIPSQSKGSKREDHEYSALCVSSAKNLLSLFPEEPDVVWLFQSAPWWCVLHYIIQAGAIIVMEVVFGAVHGPDSQDDLLPHARKVLLWLEKISNTGAAARRAWLMMSRLLTLSLHKIGRDPEWLSELTPAHRCIIRPGVVAVEEAPGPSTFVDQLNSAFLQPFHEIDEDPMPFVPATVSRSEAYGPVFPTHDLWASPGGPAARALLPATSGMQLSQEENEFGFEPMMDIDTSEAGWSSARTRSY